MFVYTITKPNGGSAGWYSGMDCLNNKYFLSPLVATPQRGLRVVHSGDAGRCYLYPAWLTRTPLVAKTQDELRALVGKPRAVEFERVEFFDV